MNLQEFLSRIKNNFFAIIIPGFFILFYIVVNGYCLLYKEIKDITPGNKCSNSPANMLLLISTALKDNWPMVLLAVVFAYLIGSILYTLQVSMADNVTNTLFSWTYHKKDTWRRLSVKTNFPYPAILNHIREGIGLIPEFSIKKQDLNNLYLLSHGIFLLK